MAFKKKLTVKGYDYEYWTITDYSSNKAGNFTHVYLRLYKDKETRDEDLLSFVDSVELNISGYGLSLEEIYEAAKKAETSKDLLVDMGTKDETRVTFFSDAEDA